MYDILFVFTLDSISSARGRDRMEHNYSVTTENKYSFLLGDGEEPGDLEESLAELKLNKEKEKKDPKKKGKASVKTGKVFRKTRKTQVYNKFYFRLHRRKQERRSAEIPIKGPGDFQRRRTFRFHRAGLRSRQTEGKVGQTPWRRGGGTA